MKPRRELAFIFWNAAMLFHRDPSRNMGPVIAALAHVASQSSGALQRRASTLLQKVRNHVSAE